jgi:predicted HNH restriction endonuclease
MAIKRYPCGSSALTVKARSRARDRYWDYYDQDSHACRACGATDVPLEVHHKDGDCLNNNLINLAAVCHFCHKATHRTHRTVESVSAWKATVKEITQ